MSACDETVTGGSEAGDTVGKPLVLATNYPLYFFTSEIAGDAVDVRMPDIDGDPAVIPPCGCPSFHTAGLILLNGTGYELWLAYTSRSATADIQGRLLPIES